MAPQSNILVLSLFSLVQYLKPWLKEIIVFQLQQKNIYIYIYIYKIAFHLKKKRKKKKIYIIAFHLKLSEVWNYSTLIQRKLSLSLSLRWSPSWPQRCQPSLLTSPKPLILASFPWPQNPFHATFLPLVPFIQSKVVACTRSNWLRRRLPERFTWSLAPCSPEKPPPFFAEFNLRAAMAGLWTFTSFSYFLCVCYIHAWNLCGL